MSDEREDRRKLIAGPPTLLTLAYEKWSPEKRKWLFWVGVGLLIFTVALPLVAGIWVDLPNIYWGFAIVGFVAGLSCMSPELGIFIASIAGKLIPISGIKHLLSNPDRRNHDD